MRYSLRRTCDDAGDSGMLSEALWYEGKELKREQNAKPRVGVAMRVGTPFARTYEAQDYWTTTYIAEILEERDTEEGKYVKFKTGNSVYEWESF